MTEDQLGIKDNLILDKSVNFSILIINLYKKLKEQDEFIISKQLLRSGTSIGANIMESQYGESKKDFIHKLGIALKEANETLYWIFLLKKGELVKSIDFDVFIKETKSIIAILTKIIKTSKQ